MNYRLRKHFFALSACLSYVSWTRVYSRECKMSLPSSLYTFINTTVWRSGAREMLETFENFSSIMRIQKTESEMLLRPLFLEALCS